MKRFTNQYSRSATLRFELIPQRETLENFMKNHMLEKDEDRADAYTKVKTIIDEYHKQFMELALNQDILQVHSREKNDSLTEYYTYYTKANKDEKEQKAFDKLMDNMRKQIAKAFKDHKAFATLFSKELIKDDLPEFVKNQDDAEKIQEELELVNKFDGFTTYFQGFFDNRKNMYSNEAKSTSVGYRLIHQNLPKFIDNMGSWSKICTKLSQELLQRIYSTYEEYLNVSDIAQLFVLDYYNIVLTQKHIDIYNNVVGELNKEINLYNQQQKDKSDKLPKLKVLFKQILSDRESLATYLPQQIESDQQLLDIIATFYEQFDKTVLQAEAEKVMLKDLLTHLDEYELSGIFVPITELSKISTVLLGQWGALEQAQKSIMLAELVKEIPQKKTQKEAKYKEVLEKELEKRLKAKRSVSLQEINYWLSITEVKPTVQSYFASCGARETETYQEINIFNQITCAKADIDDYLESKLDSRSRLNNKKDFVEKLKTLFDAFQKLIHFVKPLYGRGDEVGKDERFYADLEQYQEIFSEANILYNAVRNYITKKPYSTEKIKLNFNNYQLLKGWDANKELECNGVLLMKDGKYFLGIINKDVKRNKCFVDIEPVTAGEDTYEKMYLRSLPKVSQNLPRIVFSKKNIGLFDPDEELKRKKEAGCFKVNNDNFDREFLYELIDFYKKCLTIYAEWKTFTYTFSDTRSYTTIADFYREVEHQSCVMYSQSFPSSYIDELVSEGRLFLFQIYNKDFSPYSKGKPNLHTIYWKMLFDPRNLQNIVYQLQGNAEVFYRKSSIGKEDVICHPANQAIDNKKDYNKSNADFKAQSTFDYDIVKDRRYTVDKFHFHVPLKMNFKADENGNLNEAVQGAIRDGVFEHVIGIDRGERHLLYLTMIDMNGKIVLQRTLNEIIDMYQGKTISTNYHSLLDKREKERDVARKSWQSINDIKNLKSGYLSQVVHVIAKLIVEYKALVILEDLNMGFKNSRKKVEKQVYQEFEKMLINKLNYLVDKGTDPEQPGGALKAYQLSNQFESFSKMGKQSGVLFYVPAWMTSKIDPVTGFCNMLDTRYESVAKTKQLFNNMNTVKYNSEKEYFEFTFDYKKYTKRADGTRTLWTVCTVGNRIKTYRDPAQNSQWVSAEYDLTAAFRELFVKHDIDYSKNLKDEIVSQDTKDFFVELLHLLKATMQLRNSMTNSEVDYLVSPVANAQGVFFNSNDAKSESPDAQGYWHTPYPIDADANGAFNIARKGLWCVEQIKKAVDGKKPKLAISNKEWLKFVQDMDK